MTLHRASYRLTNPCHEQGWLYMAEIPALPGCRAWGHTVQETLAELSAVASQFILSYRERGKLIPQNLSETDEPEHCVYFQA